MEPVSAVEVGLRCAGAGLPQQQQTPSLTQELRLPASDFLSLLRFLVLAWVSITSENNQPAASPVSCSKDTPPGTARFGQKFGSLISSLVCLHSWSLSAVVTEKVAMQKYVDIKCRHLLLEGL